MGVTRVFQGSAAGTMGAEAWTPSTQCAWRLTGERQVGWPRCPESRHWRAGALWSWNSTRKQPELRRKRALRPRWGGSDRIEKGRKVRQLFPLLTYSLLLAAVQKGFDVFNALDLMENKTFLEKLKFGIGDGNLQYYLYNWKCPSMGAEKVRKLLGLPRPGSWWSKGRAWVWDPASVWALVNWCWAPCKPLPRWPD